MATEYKQKAGMSIGSEKKAQLRYNNESKADKQIPVLPMPFLTTADASTAAVKVGKGNLCRVHGSGTEYVAFGGSGMTAPDANSQDALLLEGITLVVATDDFIRTSAAIRVEVMED